MIFNRFAIICGLGMVSGLMIAHAQSGFGQDSPPRSLHEIIAATEADLHAINSSDTPLSALPRLPWHMAGELVFPIAPPRTDVAPSTPISLTRLKHKVSGGARRAFQKAWKLDKEGKAERALEEFRRAIALDPDYADAHCDLGALYLRLERYADAETEFRRAVALAPELSGIQSNLGWALAVQGKTAEAEASARLALRIWNGNPRAHQLLARILAASPQTQPEAIEHLEAAVKLLSSATGPLQER